MQHGGCEGRIEAHGVATVSGRQIPDNDVPVAAGREQEATAARPSDVDDRLDVALQLDDRPSRLELDDGDDAIAAADGEEAAGELAGSAVEPRADRGDVVAVARIIEKDRRVQAEVDGSRKVVACEVSLERAWASNRSDPLRAGQRRV